MCVPALTRRRAFVLYTKAEHTCVYVYKQMGRSSSSGGSERGSRAEASREFIQSAIESRGLFGKARRLIGRQTHRWTQMF